MRNFYLRSEHYGYCYMYFSLSCVLLPLFCCLVKIFIIKKLYCVILAGVCLFLVKHNRLTVRKVYSKAYHCRYIFFHIIGAMLKISLFPVRQTKIFRILPKTTGNHTSTQRSYLAGRFGAKISEILRPEECSTRLIHWQTHWLTDACRQTNFIICLMLLMDRVDNYRQKYTRRSDETKQVML